MVINGGTDMVEIPDRFKSLFSYRGYPFIDLKYNTLETIIDKANIDIKDIKDDK